MGMAIGIIDLILINRAVERMGGPGGNRFWVRSPKVSMILTVQHTDHLKLQSNIILPSINYNDTFLRKRGCIMPRVDDRAVDLWKRDLYSLRMIGRELGVRAAHIYLESVLYSKY